MEGFTDEFSGTWPDWATMRAGECFPLSTPARYIDGSAFSLLPTPMAGDGRAWTIVRKSNVVQTVSTVFNRGKQLYVIYYLMLCGYSANRAADFTETMMGFPKHWTDLTAAATP